MMPSSVLTIRAGKRALAHMLSEGFRAADVEIVPGAAGGPKGLGIAGLDRAIFGEWLPAAPGVRHLIGSSIGAGRFAAASRKDPPNAPDEFARPHTQQRHPPPPRAGFGSPTARRELPAPLA